MRALLLLVRRHLQQQRALLLCGHVWLINDGTRGRECARVVVHGRWTDS
jgi:hypothetical protein